MPSPRLDRNSCSCIRQAIAAAESEKSKAILFFTVGLQNPVEGNHTRRYHHNEARGTLLDIS